MIKVSKFELTLTNIQILGKQESEEEKKFIQRPYEFVEHQCANLEKIPHCLPWTDAVSQAHNLVTWPCL